MKELNHDTLREAVLALPSYNPPIDLWDEIERALDSEDALAESVQVLPQYEPPAAVWQHLEAELSAAPSRAIRRPMLRLVARRAQWLAAAAVAGVLIAAWWMLHPVENDSEGSVIAVRVTQEVVNAEVQTATQEKEDEGFSLVSQLCQSKAPVCEDPDFKLLKSELEELTAAKQEIRSALGQYGDDPDMAAQLVQIERERSELLRQMMQMI